MQIVTDLNLLSQINEISNWLRGVYVMRKVRDQISFRAGAVRVNGGNNNAAQRLIQVNNHPLNRENPYEYVLFAVANEGVNLRAAEIVLFGQLCQAFKYERNSGFLVNNPNMLSNVQAVAAQAVLLFDNLRQYNP